MKKLLPFFMILSALSLRAQPIIVSPTVTCAQGFSTYIFAGATINPSLYTHYVWTFSYTNTNSSMFVVNGSSNSSTVQIAITQASGSYTVTGTAMNGSTPIG